VAADVLADRRIGPAERGRWSPLNAAGLVAELDRLHDLDVNFDDADGPRGADDPRWHVDSGLADLGTEVAGPPTPGGAFDTACALVRDYEFTDHRLIRGIYRPAGPLLGRDMLLEGRFLALRFYLGVRVTAVVDETREGPDGPLRVWGWTYRTLDGHLEQGTLTYEITKDLGSGAVTFGIHAFSRRAPIPNPLVRMGFGVFGRSTQLSFYQRAGRRMHRLVTGHSPGDPLPRPAPLLGDVVIAPSASRTRPWDPLALPVTHPGTRPGRAGVRRDSAADRA